MLYSTHLKKFQFNRKGTKLIRTSPLKTEVKTENFAPNSEIVDRHLRPGVKFFSLPSFKSMFVLTYFLPLDSRFFFAASSVIYGRSMSKFARISRNKKPQKLSTWKMNILDCLHV